ATTGTAPRLRSVAATPSPHGPPRGTSTRQPVKGFVLVLWWAVLIRVTLVVQGRPLHVRAADGRPEIRPPRPARSDRRHRQRPHRCHCPANEYTPPPGFPFRRPDG